MERCPEYGDSVRGRGIFFRSTSNPCYVISKLDWNRITHIAAGVLPGIVKNTSGDLCVLMRHEKPVIDLILSDPWKGTHPIAV